MPKLTELKIIGQLTEGADAPVFKPDDEIAFEVKYTVDWEDAPVHERLQLDLGLFEIDPASQQEAAANLMSALVGTPKTSWDEQYVSMSEKGFRVFGTKAAKSIVLEREDPNAVSPHTVQRIIQWFIATHAWHLTSNAVIEVPKPDGGVLVLSTIPTSAVNTLLEQSGYNESWKLPNQALQTKSTGSVVLRTTRAQIQQAADKGEESATEAVQEIKAWGRLSAYQPKPQVVWSQTKEGLFGEKKPQ